MSDSRVILPLSTFVQTMRAMFPRNASESDDELIAAFDSENPQCRLIREGDNVSLENLQSIFSAEVGRQAEQPYLPPEPSDCDPASGTAPTAVLDNKSTESGISKTVGSTVWKRRFNPVLVSFGALLLCLLTLAGYEFYRSFRAKQELKNAEMTLQKEEAARNRQAELEKQEALDRERKAREELGDEIESRVNDWFGPNVSTTHNLPPGTLDYVSQMAGWRTTSSKMFINRRTGVLTITLNCKFYDAVGQYNVSRNSPDYSTQYLPLLVRLFDGNGQYITHFETSELYGKSVMNRNSDHNVGGRYMKELQDSTVVQYSINQRDAAFVQIGEVGHASD